MYILYFFKAKIIKIFTATVLDFFSLKINLYHTRIRIRFVGSWNQLHGQHYKIQIRIRTPGNDNSINKRNSNNKKNAIRTHILYGQEVLTPFS